MSTIPITVRGAQLLKEELQRLKHVERPAVITAIAEARAQGDLSENAEYDAAKEKQQRGTVIAVGPGRLLESGERSPVSVKVGDQVLFGKYGGTEIEVDGQDVKILRESDILAKLV